MERLRPKTSRPPSTEPYTLFFRTIPYSNFQFHLFILLARIEHTEQGQGISDETPSPQNKTPKVKTSPHCTQTLYSLCSNVTV